MTEFIKVAKTSDLAPGEMMRVKAHDDCILLVNHEREYYALSDTCSHEDASLYLGVLDGDTIRCPLHGSRFNIKTGIPMEEPAEEPVDAIENSGSI